MSATKKPAEKTLAEVAEAVAKATRLKDASVALSPSGHEARIVFEGRSLCFMHTTRSGIRLHVQHHPGRKEERFTAATVAEAAKLVKTSERREPKPKAEAPKLELVAAA